MELWDAYDREGNLLPGHLIRGEKIPQGQYHLVGCILVRHRDGRYLLMLRSPEKEVWPNAWEIGAGGSALQGESSLACAGRELYEETGIADGTLIFLDRFVNDETQTIYDGYLCVTDIRPDAVRLQDGETVDYRWVTEQDFVKFFYSDQCIPRIRRRLQKYVDSLPLPVDEKGIF